jgi:hypothetical protein
VKQRLLIEHSSTSNLRNDLVIAQGEASVARFGCFTGRGEYSYFAGFTVRHRLDIWAQLRRKELSCLMSPRFPLLSWLQRAAQRPSPSAPIQAPAGVKTCVEAEAPHARPTRDSAGRDGGGGGYVDARR